MSTGKITRDLPVVVPARGGGAPRPRWKPPGRGPRILLAIGVVLGAVALIRRWPLPIDRSSIEIAGAREVVAYALGADVLTMSLPPGSTLYKILTNLDLPADVAPEGIPYVVRVRVPEDGRDDEFALLGRPARDAAGKATAFFRDRAGAPARTTVLTLQRISSRPATLQLSLQIPGGRAALGQGSLRVFVAHERMGQERGAPPVDSVGGVALEDLAPDVRAAFASRSWHRLPARSKSPTRTMFLPAADAPRPDPDPGELVGAGAVLAATMKGPGTVDVQADPGLPAAWAQVLCASGSERSFALVLPAQGQASVPIGKGLCTLRIAAAKAPVAARVRLTASRPGMILTTAATTGTGRDEGTNDDTNLGPRWSWQSVARAQPDGDPVAFLAAGRQQAAFALTARVALGPRLAAGTGAAALLRWRFVDLHGAALAQGKATIDATAAPEDRLDEIEGRGLVSRPTTFYLWPPRAAHRLLLDADRATVVSAGSPGFDDDRAEPPAAWGPMGDGMVLRHGPLERQAFYAVRALNAADLQRQGRLERFAGALRLERAAAHAKPVSAAVSLSPRRDGGRFEVLLPLDRAAPAQRPGRLWAVRREHDEEINVPRPQGTSGAARVPTTLLYEVRRPSGRQPLLVHLDGQIVGRASLLGARGQVVLPPLPVGRHRLRVDLASEARLFINQPVAAALSFRRSQIYRFAAGAAAVAVPKARAARALGTVVYLDGPPPHGRAGGLDVVVEGGVRRSPRQGGASAAYTRLRRHQRLDFLRAPGAVTLNRTSGEIWASRPIFIPLGDDLGAGSHLVSLRPRGLGSRPMVRFFSYGGTPVNRINQHVEVSVESAPIADLAPAPAPASRRSGGKNAARISRGAPARRSR